MSSDMSNPTIDILTTAPDSEEIKRLLDSLDSNMEYNFDCNHRRAIVNQTDFYALLDKINAVCYNHSLKLLTTTPVTDNVAEVIVQYNEIGIMDERKISHIILARLKKSKKLLIY
ncbi:hypothetical protein CDAR_12741 [Caerostris darwini]|uniref:Uncharacterized protein n=1 Tax=Caerostris darwini TaxID=1538125 RepID=A0AAV4NQJ8_9ARAC|nr:hypothetical protein CDAR_12741 [Caerostris darwini]